MPASSPPPALVLDTNALLDWLLFRDAGMAACAAAIEAGVVRWLCCPRAVDELAATLRKPALQRWTPDCERVLTVVNQLAIRVPDPAPTRAPLLRCSDPDDQIFIELALAHQARWLLTHDRALLKLARRARPLGTQILPPAAWGLAAAATPEVPVAFAPASRPEGDGTK